MKDRAEAGMEHLVLESSQISIRSILLGKRSDSGSVRERMGDRWGSRAIRRRAGVWDGQLSDV